MLYSQLRARPLTPCPVSDMAFYEENTVRNTRQAWSRPLTEAEASAVAGYTSRRARWLDLMCSSPSKAASALGMTQFSRLEGLERELRSAVSKSLTECMLLRHYVRGIPSPPPGEAPLKGRVYVLRSYMSCSLVPRDVPGYGVAEVRIVAPSGAGRGVFVTGSSGPADAEFLLIPGTTLRITAARRDLLLAEQVRPLSLSWNGRSPAPYDTGMVREDAGCGDANRSLLERFRTSSVPGLFPDIDPAPTAGW